MTNEAIVDQVKAGIVNSVSGRIGSFDTPLDQDEDNARHQRRRRSRPSTVGDAQPFSLPQVSASISAPMDSTTKIAPIPVDLAAAGVAEVRHLERDHRQRDHRGWQVDVEAPAPASDVHARNVCAAMVGEITADDRADDAGKAEDRAEEASVLAALARREKVGDGCERGGEQRAAANALDAAEDDQLHHSAAQEPGMSPNSPESPHSHEPATKMTIPTIRISLRP